MATESEAAMQAAFLAWCSKNGLSLSKNVEMSCDKCCHRFGLIASSGITNGDVLFKVPRKLLLNASNSKIGRQIGEYDEAHSTDLMEGSPSGWVPLLLALMYECSQGDKSLWAPYLKLIPLPEDMSQPCLWPANEIKALLSGLLLKDEVFRDIENMKMEFETFAQPFLLEKKDLFKPCYSTLDFYMQLACFIMAYSFTEEDTGVSMVPMADILNHHSNNNAHLEFGKKYLSMVATKDIKKGDEIFNTFGQIGNASLLQMYGYVEKDNPFEKVSVQLSEFVDHIQDLSATNLLLLDLKWQYLSEKMDVQPGDTIDVSMLSVENGKDIAEAMQVLLLSAKEFMQVVSAEKDHHSLSSGLMEAVMAASSQDAHIGTKRQADVPNKEQTDVPPKAMRPMMSDQEGKTPAKNDLHQRDDIDDEGSSDDDDDDDGVMATDDVLLEIGTNGRSCLERTIKSRLSALKNCDHVESNISRHSMASALKHGQQQLCEAILRKIDKLTTEQAALL